MRGKMLWFNEVKDVGVIVSDEGERLAVSGCDFVDGARPQGRCAKAAVSFEVSASAERKALRAALLPDEPRRRARLRHPGGTRSVF
jgi:hypothetical protein